MCSWFQAKIPKAPCDVPMNSIQLCLHGGTNCRESRRKAKQRRQVYQLAPEKAHRALHEEAGPRILYSTNGAVHHTRRVVPTYIHKGPLLEVYESAHRVSFQLLEKAEGMEASECLLCEKTNHPSIDRCRLSIAHAV